MLFSDKGWRIASATSEFDSELRRLVAQDNFIHSTDFWEILSSILANENSC